MGDEAPGVHLLQGPSKLFEEIAEALERPLPPGGEKGAVDDDPSDRLETPRKSRMLPDVLSLKEVEAMLASPQADESLAWRDRALLELAYGAGLRASELSGLSVTDLELAKGWFA
jgi:site-specific recombinase XerD